MAPGVSKLDTLPFNCYELGHTWTPSCSKATFDMATSCFQEANKIYATCYLVILMMSMIASQRIPKSVEEVWKVAKDVLRSSTFLSANAFGFMFFLCSFRKLKGNFNYFTLAFIPSVVGCYCAIFIEKSQRRPLLALYVANVASETLFRMLRSRGLVREVKHFNLLLFCSSLITMLYYMKGGNRRNDFVDSIITKIFGNEEFSQKRLENIIPGGLHDLQNDANNPLTARRNSAGVHDHAEALQRVNLETSRRIPPREESYRARIVRVLLWMHRAVEDIACHLETMVTAVYEDQKHEKCPHKEPCLDYWLKGFCSRFLSGFAIQSAIQSAGFIRALLLPRKPHLDKTGTLMSNSLLLPCVKTGLGLGAMNLSFRLFSCSFRWLQGTDDRINAAASGVLASALGFFFLRPPSAAGLYLFFKAVERVISESHQRNNWKILLFLDKIYGGGWTILYALSSGIIFHCGIVEPQNLKPSYYNFMKRITGKRLLDFNRHLFTVYYAQSNLLTKSFWPAFNEKYLSEPMKTLIKLRDASGTGNEFIRDIALKFVSGAAV